jgi:phospholipid/cholesterol/gamma-HCH transport system substrate-binding protein
MRAAIREHLIEALVGLLVVLVAVWFIYMAWERTGGGREAGAIHVKALFPNVSGIDNGADVRVAGMKIGSVISQRLDPSSYQAELTLALDKDVHVPVDSSAAITSEGILGRSYIALIPGGEQTPLKNGDTIADTQGSIDLMGMVGQFINKSGASGSSGGNSSSSSGTAAPGAAAASTP